MNRIYTLIKNGMPVKDVSKGFVKSIHTAGVGAWLFLVIVILNFMQFGSSSVTPWGAPVAGRVTEAQQGALEYLEEQARHFVDQPGVVPDQDWRAYLRARRLDYKGDLALCQNKWLVGRLRRWASTLARGETIMQCSPVRFRWVWAQARKELRVPERYTPYGLRRGGATSCFRDTSSFDRVADRGRWGSVSACRLYVTTSLQAAAMQDFAGHHPLWQRWASRLWELPA